MIKPKTRKEKLLSAIANDTPVTIQPKNREEIFLAQIAEKVNIVNAPVTENISENASVLVEDGGEVKRVAKSKVGGGGGATSLDDLLMKQTLLMDEQVLTFSDEGDATVSLIASAAGFSAVSVTWDGVTYLCNALYLSGMKVFGNLFFTGVALNSDVPFAVTFTDDTTAVFIPVDGTVPPTVKMSGVEFVQVPVGAVAEAVPTTFYVRTKVDGEDPYIYTDAMLTTKATQVDLLSTNYNESGVRVVVAVNGTPFVVCAPLYIGTDGTAGVIAICDYTASDATVIKYCTAEYVPPTT